MRNILLLVFLAAMACNADRSGSSNNIPKDLKNLHQEVLAIHDEVMPKMSVLTSLQAQLGEKLVELRSQQPINMDKLKETNQVLGQLNRAESAMWDWMDRFSGLDSIPDTEKEVFLLNEKSSAEDMKNLMLSSIKNAEKFIAENPLNQTNENG